jgi:OFA family oxalate/formate antiporter-like MFS transporter
MYGLHLYLEHFSRSVENGAPEWTLADIALIFSLLVLTYAITTVISGRLQDRIGPRLVVTAGGIMMGCGAFLAGSMDTWWD